MPTITQTELNKLRNRQGVYSQLSNSPKSLRIVVNNLIESAFREYVRSHKGKHITKQLEDESWTRFNKILQKYL